MKIGVFDSGSGGKTTLAEIKKLIPEAEYHYIGDIAHHPYGGKTREELIEITTGVVQELVDWGAEVVVIACNTATTQCIRALRERFPDVIFVGTEPAVKVACSTRAELILILVTPATADSEQLKRLIEENMQHHQMITVRACEGLAEAVEAGDEAKVNELLDEIYQATDGGLFDAVVLGCTHYVAIREQIQRRFPGAKLYDGNAGVARRVRAIAAGLVK